jgi:hypothetical protein
MSLRKKFGEISYFRFEGNSVSGYGMDPTGSTDSMVVSPCEKKKSTDFRIQ